MCIVKGCKNKTKYTGGTLPGYCNRHYLQMNRYGMIFNRTWKDKNEIVELEDCYEICLYGGFGHNQKEIARTKISKCDLKNVINYKWGLSGRINGKSRYVSSRTGGIKIYLHQLIMGNKDGFEIDHKNINTLDNRRENLRFVTRSQNNLNRNGNQGVRFDKKSKKWHSSITINYKKISLGYFNNKEEAIICRKEAENKHLPQT